MTQNQKLLQALREAGANGLHSRDIRIHLHLGDPAKRVCELRELGHDIERTPERRHGKHGARYTLKSSVAVPNTSAAPASSPSRADSGRKLPDADGRSTSPPAGRSGVGQPLPEVTLVDLERACAWALEADPGASLETALRATPIRSRRVEMEIAA